MIINFKEKEIVTERFERISMSGILLSFAILVLTFSFAIIVDLIGSGVSQEIKLFTMKTVTYSLYTMIGFSAISILLLLIRWIIISLKKTI
jgi:hypothetical protein